MATTVKLNSSNDEEATNLQPSLPTSDLSNDFENELEGLPLKLTPISERLYNSDSNCTYYNEKFIS